MYLYILLFTYKSVFSHVFTIFKQKRKIEIYHHRRTWKEIGILEHGELAILYYSNKTEVIPSVTYLSTQTKQIKS